MNIVEELVQIQNIIKLKKLGESTCIIYANNRENTLILNILVNREYPFGNLFELKQNSNVIPLFSVNSCSLSDFSNNFVSNVD